MEEKVSADNGNEFPFFIMRENSVSLQQLYEEVKLFCGDNGEAPKNVFLDCIEAMFSARRWNYWNHLVTFDNAPTYNRNDFLTALDDLSGEKAIYIRCTKAGEQYLKTLCTHYEFFACRYITKSVGLFSDKNFEMENGQYRFNEQIKVVYEKVEMCCKELKRVNEAIIHALQYANYTDLLDSHYLIDHKFHEERIIHNHISYLDGFRLYLINGPLKGDIINVNTILIEHIENYVKLLKYNDSSFYSPNSQTLSMELSACIKHIEQNGYNDATTVISRDYYNNELHPMNNGPENIAN